MSSRPWLRLYTAMVDDERILSLTAEDRWHFVALMCCKLKGIQDRPWGRDQIMRHLAAKLSINQRELLELERRLVVAGLLQHGTFQPTDGAAADLIGPHNPTRPPAHVWRSIRDFIFKRDDYTCRYCGERGQKLECDHVIPVSRGGGHDYSNLVTACLMCNRSKRDKLLADWRPA